MTEKGTWSTLPVNVKGDANKNFAPRALIQATVEVIARNKTKLNIPRLKHDSLDDAENLPATEISVAEIIEQLKSASHEFRSVKVLLAAN